MLVYDAVATQGLAKEDAAAYADWLRFVVTKGQHPGEDQGQLPAGYLPLTAANGLDGLADYSLKAADAIEAQDGNVPPPPKTPSDGNPPNNPNAPPPNHGPGDTPNDPPPGEPLRLLIRRRHQMLNS